MDHLVDVLMPVYNHEKFLVQAIEGIVHQKANFTFRLIAGEDCSKDNSRLVLSKYAALYPEIVFPVFHEKNQGSTANFADIYARATAKYIAICEGDDYWTNPTKLQKQVDFLETHPDYSLCFTDVDIVDEIGLEQPNPYPVQNKDVFEMKDILAAKRCFIPTPTMVFRNVIPVPFPAFYTQAISGDIALHLMLSEKGKIKQLHYKTAVYRQHHGGITKSQFVLDNAFLAQFRLYENINAYFGHKYNDIFRAQLSDMSKVALIFGSKEYHGLSKLKYVSKNAGRYFKYNDQFSLKEILYFTCVIFFPALLKGRKNGIAT